MAGPLLTTNVVSAKKKATKKAATPRKAAKRIVKKAAVKTTAKKKVAAKQVVKKATTVDIGKAAYLFYLKRRETSAPGTSEGDWLEAERLLSK